MAVPVIARPVLERLQLATGRSHELGRTLTEHLGAARPVTAIVCDAR
jgi:hypothetical protein